MTYKTGGSSTTYYYLTNVQGDIVAIVDGTGATVATYSYDAWGNPLSTPTGDIGILNPLRYRGYVYDTETGLYYLRSRYYNPELGRFISPDVTDVLTLTPMSLTDKNLFAYCDNNPVMRTDDEGNFWLTSICIAVAWKYVDDVIENISEGKSGWDIFVPHSSALEYATAGAAALVPGSGVLSSLGSTAIELSGEVATDIIEGEPIYLDEIAGELAFGTVVDYEVGLAEGKVKDYIDTKKPQNYSSHAHTMRKSNPSVTKLQIYKSMKRRIAACNLGKAIASLTADALSNVIIDR